MSSIQSVCVFCGAQNAVDKKYLDMGSRFGSMLAESKIRLVYGGGDCGLMGAVANSVMQGGGHATGVFPISLRNLENEHKSLSEIVIVGSMHERKKLMFDLSHAFVVLPGGFGTMDEMFEILTWRQLQLHEKPVIIVNYDGYWDKLIALMDNIIGTRFARAETSSFYQVVSTPEDAMEILTGR
jgi:uncharacterized protein (TIGR00730 family)